jgi:hypothetical protein
MSDDLEFDDWVQRAKDSDILQTAMALGAQLKRAGSAEHVGPCPVCGGTDRFSVNTKQRVFNCRGAGGGGIVDMVAHIMGVEPKGDGFVRVCETILDEPPPKRQSAMRPRDPAIDRERREERKDDEIARERKESAELLRSIERATALFEQGAPIEGTKAEDYLDRRGISLESEICADLRFVPNLAYRGHVHKPGARDENGDPLPDAEAELGAYHCMIAAVRDAQGRITGIHRTYLDAGKTTLEGVKPPSGQPIKLRPPGDRTRNRAKKGTFRMGGGLIMLGPASETLAIGEGIETALSWRALARVGWFGDDFAGASVAAAYSLGNLCGGATGTIPHPKPPKGSPNATIANGEPDMTSAAMWIPPGVKRLALLGDGDSDPAATRALLCTGAERFRRLGLEVFVCMSPPGFDWNDVLLAVRARDAA